jgi:hypothetical protein
MSQLMIASTHFALGPVVLVLILIGLLRIFSRPRVVVSGVSRGAGASALSLPVVVGIIAFTTYLAAMTANGAHAMRWLSSMGMGMQGSGTKAVQTRPLDAFKELRVDGQIAVEFVPSTDKPQAVVEGDDNIVSLIKTNVSDGVLHVELDSNNSSLSPVVPMHVRVTGPAVASAGVTSAGTLALTDLHVGSLSLKSDAAANLTATGTVDDLKVEVDSAGVCDASKLTAAHANVRCDSASKAKVNVSESLDAKAEAASAVTATGKADTVTLNGGGAAEFHLKDLLAKNVDVNLGEATSAHVNASGAVTGKVEGGSTLKIGGSPASVDAKADEGSIVSRG